MQRIEIKDKAGKTQFLVENVGGELMLEPDDVKKLGFMLAPTVNFAEIES